MTLDYTTVHFCNSLLNVSYGIMLLIVALKRRETHFLLWAGSLLLVSAAVWGFTLANARWEVAVLLGCVTANVSLVWAGLRSFDGRPAFQVRMLFAPLLVAVIFWIVASLGEPGLARATSASLMGLNVLFVGNYLRSKSSDRGLGRRIVACALLAYVPIYAMSAMMSVAGYDSATAGNIILAADFALNNVFVVGLFVLTEDRTRRKLHELAMTDPLTGAHNRGGFLGRVEDQLSGKPIALLLVDLDHFKTVNDTYGHAAGDAVLRKFVEKVEGTLHDGEFIGRLGGEEFGVVLPGADWETAIQRAESIRHVIHSSPVPWDARDIHVTVSIGIATRIDGETTELTMRRCDDALYRAKSAGRNRVAA